MTEGQVKHLMAVVRLRLREAGYYPGSHPEFDDLLAEGFVHAWQAVERLGPESPYRWVTIAGREGVWAAKDYLNSRRSGRLASGQAAKPSYRQARGRALSEREAETMRHPVPLSGVPSWIYETVWDGGMKAADARLQLWLLRPKLSAKQQAVLRLLYQEGLSISEAARRLEVNRETVHGHWQGALARYRAELKEET